jgi:hypothetical protein
MSTTATPSSPWAGEAIGCTIRPKGMEHMDMSSKRSGHWFSVARM